MCPHDAARQPLAVLARRSVPNRSDGAAARAEVERATPATSGRRDRRGKIGRTPVGPALELVHQCDRGRCNPAATRATRPTTLTATHASRNKPFVRSTGIQAQAERQIRSTASAVVTMRSGSGDEDAQLDQRAAERDAELERGDRDGPADQHDDAQHDVVPLERRRGDLRHGPRRQALQAGRQGRRWGPPGDRAPACPAPSADRRSSWPECSRGRHRARLQRARLADVGVLDRDATGRDTTSGSRARCRTARAGAARRPPRRAPQSASRRSTEARSWPSAVRA